MATFLVVLKSNSVRLLVKREECQERAFETWRWVISEWYRTAAARVRAWTSLRLRDRAGHHELLHAARAGHGGDLRRRRRVQGFHSDHRHRRRPARQRARQSPPGGDPDHDAAEGRNVMVFTDLTIALPLLSRAWPRANYTPTFTSARLPGRSPLCDILGQTPREGFCKARQLRLNVPRGIKSKTAHPCRFIENPRCCRSEPNRHYASLTEPLLELFGLKFGPYSLRVIGS